MFTLRLCSPARDHLGTYRATVPNWSAGDLLYEGGDPKYRVRSVIAADDADSPLCAILEVEPV
jgi:hypothetical protein